MIAKVDKNSNMDKKRVRIGVINSNKNESNLSDIIRGILARKFTKKGGLN